MKKLISSLCITVFISVNAFSQIQVDSTGKVGVGTNTPSTQLDIDGNTRIRGLSGKDIRPVFTDSDGNLVVQDLVSQTNTNSFSIPDDNCTGITSTININGYTTSVQSIDICVTLNATHTYISNLYVFLISPNGDTLNLLFANGGSGDNLVNTVFSDAGASIFSGSPPYTGIFNPNGTLSSFACSSIKGSISTLAQIAGGSLVPNGNWQLLIIDKAGADIGQLNDWTLTFNKNGEQMGKNNYLPKWIGGALSDSSSIYDNGNIGIGTHTPTAMLEVTDDILVNGISLGKGTGNISTNTAMGYHALDSNTTGDYNTTYGYQTLINNNTGYRNTATGFEALYSNTSGYRNTSTGYRTLYSNTTGYQNTAHGYYALGGNTIGYNNSAYGHYALLNNNTGDENTAIGFEALYNNTGGYGNNATGYRALYSNTVGRDNTASGMNALHFNTSGTVNVAIGVGALYSNTSAHANTAVGNSALSSNTTGGWNTGVGKGANSTGTAYGNSTGLGHNADVSATNEVRIGNSSVTSISGQVGWSYPSDKRFKKNIRNDEVIGLDFIKKLEPVTYYYSVDAYAKWKEENYGEKDEDDWEGKYDIEEIRFSGFLAQDVETIAEEVGYDFSGIDKPKNSKDTYKLRYSEFVVPLVKAVQEQQAIIESQSSKIESQNEKIVHLSEQLNEVKIYLNMKAEK